MAEKREKAERERFELTIRDKPRDRARGVNKRELVLSFDEMREMAYYVVDGAVIKCDQMSSEGVVIRHEEGRVILSGEGGSVEKATPDAKQGAAVVYPGFPKESDQEKIRRLFAVHTTGQTINGIPLTTVSDRNSLHEVEQREGISKNPKEYTSIISFGHCKIIREDDIEKIEADSEKVHEYGTCYCLLSPDSEWINPYCIECVIESADTQDGEEAGDPGSECTVSTHHHVMKWSTRKGKEEGLTVYATLLCTRGGKITIETSGQSVIQADECGDNNKMSLNRAITLMTQYLKSEEITENELNVIIDWVADNCGLTVNDVQSGQFSQGDAYARSMIYDNQIIAWTYYWNCKIEDEFSINFEIDPNIIKAMIAQESSFGSDAIGKARNPSRNVMQSLSTGNSTVWIAAGINPYTDEMFVRGDHIAYKMLDGTVGTDGSLAIDNLLAYASDSLWLAAEREKYHYEDFDIIKNIFELGEDGKYMVDFNNVTTNMSIATGVGLLAAKIESSGGNIYDGVQEYNTLNGYIESINTTLSEMGCEELEP